jgi:NCS2 family nucleobase:cation symporter-2
MRAQLDHRNLLIVAISLGIGLGVDLRPEVLKPLPQSLQLIFGSGISTGGVMAVALNLLLPRTPVATER